MILRRGTFIKHKKFRDIAYIVKHCYINSEGHLKIRFKYWNVINVQTPYDFGLPTQTAIVPMKDFYENWSILHGQF